MTGLLALDPTPHICISAGRELIETVGDVKKVLVLVSGGVDSSVCAALLNKALGPDRVVALHIDNGFMRLDESTIVEKSLRQLGLPLKVIDASETFYSATTTINRTLDPNAVGALMSPPLRSVVDPEQKRRIIGDTFMRVADEQTKLLELDPEMTFLAQGTLRPDLIESASTIASDQADAIKTHHNDTQLVRLLREKGRVVEPLKDYHKDEVRVLGRSLGLPADLINRQPFPGPGLAIRVLCAEIPHIGSDFDATNALLKYIATRDESLISPEVLGGVSAVVKSAGFLDELAEFCATLLPVRTVGVQGDGRTYSYVCAVTIPDGRQPWKALLKLAKMIPRLCHCVNRVCYVWGGAVRGPIKTVTETHLTPDVLALLKQADAVVNESLVKNQLVTQIAQVPVVLVPVDLDDSGGSDRCIAIRTFLTSDFMTGVPVCPGEQISEEVLNKIVESVQQIKGISRVMYDLTAKPPGTTEWE